jgi:outer membrane protein TolC
MKKTLVLLLSFFIIGICGFSAAAQEDFVDIGLEEYLDIVRVSHPFFNKEQLAVDIEQKQAQSILGGKDWNLSLVPTYSYLGKASAPETGGSSVQAINRAGLEASLNKPVWSTGGRLGFDVTTGYTRSDITIGVENVFRNGISATYTQPFLQNWRGVQDRLQYELSGYTVDFTQVQVFENQENFLLEVSIRFLDWAFFTREVAIREDRLDIAKQGLEEVNKRYRANLVDRVDVLRSEDSVRLAEQTLVLARSQWKAKQAELAVIAGTDEIYRRRPSYDIYRLEELPEMEESLEQLKAQSRILKNLRILREQLVFQRGGVENQKRAQLDLAVTAGMFGRDDSFVDSLAIYQPEAIVSLIFSKPLGSNTAKGQIEKIDKQIAQVDGEISSLERDLSASLVNVIIQIDDLEDVLDLNLKSIESAQEKTAEELKLYNQGRSQLTFVIQSEDNEEAAWLTYASNAYLYHTLILQYYALLDEILETE